VDEETTRVSVILTTQLKAAWHRLGLGKETGPYVVLKPMLALDPFFPPFS